MKGSLRTRVLAATLALVVAGLAVAGVATYVFLRSFLLDRVDQQLVGAQLAAAHALGETMQFGHADNGPDEGLIPAGTYTAFLDASGEPLASTRIGYEGRNAGSLPVPELPPGLPGSRTGGSDPATRTFTAPGSFGSGFRVLAVAAQASDEPGTLVIAIPLSEITGTMHRLVLVEIGVAAAVVVAVGLLGWWLVRRGLRPLDRMAETADAIAEGDLSQRVEPDDGRTEVGRLGLALNTMLGQIETAFDRQRASEDRLRRFVADASHELRTPITSIRGYAELFRRGAADSPEDLERAMRRIEDEGARMGVLVEDLLLLARLDQGRPLEREPVDLAAIVSDAVDDTRAAAPTRQIELSIEDPAAAVTGDEQRLRQVIANLLQNALDHTPPDAPVSVRLSSQDGRADLEVADRGPGLTPEEAVRVFERFYRGDPSRSRESGGTGLGLSIVAAIVDAHGGAVHVAPRPEGGSIFTVELPLAAAREKASISRGADTPQR
jgi:two-component system OmpR family sensor kinase